MQTQKRTLGEYAGGKAVAFSERAEPSMGSIVVDVGIYLECHQHISVKQPDHDSSSAASDCRTRSAVIGFFPRDTLNPPRFDGLREGWDEGTTGPVNERRSSRFKAALMEQFSSLANDRARA
jgi:hypothetical protein